MNVIDGVCEKLDIDENDKRTLANFCILFGFSGMVITFLFGTDPYAVIACAAASSALVLYKHYSHGG